MEFMSRYPSPLGEILLAADDFGLTGLWFEGQSRYARGLGAYEEGETAILTDAKRWLDVYFSGREPDFTVALHLSGTEFERAVWQALLEIPYGQTRTYGQIAKGLRCRSAQAVGGAVGRNPVSVIVPCHRVLGAGGRLTGYAGGLERKTALLDLEGIT